MQFRKQKKRDKQSGYSEMNSESSVLPPEMNPAIILLHRSCKTLKLQAFINAYSNGDLSGLVISGDPKPEALQEAWTEIVFEWSTLINNQDSDYIFSLRKKIAILASEIFYIENAVEILRKRYDDDLVNELRSMGFNVDYNYLSEEYDEQLDLVLSLAKTKVFDHAELVDEYNRLYNITTGKKQTEEQFLETVAIASKYIGFRIDTQVVTVLEFATTFNLFIKEQDALKILKR